jgi:uncharacterized cupredoxin-like copper-binding protein
MRQCSIAALVSAALVVLAAPPPPAAIAQPATRNVRVKMIDYRVRPSVTSTAARRVTFIVHDADPVPHNLRVLRTDRAPRSLPVTGRHGRAREIGRQGGTEFLHPEQTVRLALTLRPGRYLLICNVPGHYQRGMVVVFRVRG